MIGPDDHASDVNAESQAAPTRDAWRRDSTCGACRLFIDDFGAAPTLYGHCKMHRRTGSRTTADTSCPQFAPLPGFGAVITLDDLPPQTGTRARSPGGGGSADGASRRRRSVRVAQVVRRRPQWDDEIMGATLGAALFGEEGEGTMDRNTLRDAMLEVIETFIGVEDVELGEKWVGGTVTMQPADESLNAHVLPIDSLFNKVVMIRDRLRVLEAKVNANKALNSGEKVELQQYISRCYGSLTSFNILFKNKEDKFSSK